MVMDHWFTLVGEDGLECVVAEDPTVNDAPCWRWRRLWLRPRFCSLLDLTCLLFQLAESGSALSLTSQWMEVAEKEEEVEQMTWLPDIAFSRLPVLQRLVDMNSLVIIFLGKGKTVNQTKMCKMEQINALQPTIYIFWTWCFVGYNVHGDPDNFLASVVTNGLDDSQLRLWRRMFSILFHV